MDTIANFLTQIRNAISAGHDNVNTPYSTVREQIAIILKQEGYIAEVTVDDSDTIKKRLLIELGYHYEAGRGRTSTLQTIKRISKPGRRSYVSTKNIPRPLRGLGTVIVSTSQGILTGKEARKLGLGGEVICEIW